MCSIPGLPTPGSQVTVIISRVNLNPTFGLLELWVQMDDGRKHSYEQMKKDIQIPGRKFQNSEGKPEDICLVFIVDTWHRARIVSLQNQNYTVFLIDQGKPHTATSQDLAWAHSDSFVLPPEVESCILANVFSVKNNWPEKATKFLLSLSGMKFTGQVQHVLMPDRIMLLDIPIVSMHMCKLGVTKEILQEEFKCLALEWQRLTKGESSQSQSLQEQNFNGCSQLSEHVHEQYFCPQLSTGTYEIVDVTEITDDLNVFCKLRIFSEDVEKLCESIFQDYEGGSSCIEELPKTAGVSCATKGSDGKWHRSRLGQDISASDGTVKVLHVDDGKIEMVPIVDIRPLTAKFLRMPVFTYLCSLVGISGFCKEWTTHERDFIRSILLNQKVVARFERPSVLQDGYDVVLYAPNGSCINDCIMKKLGLGTLFNSESDNALNQPILSLFLSSLKNQHYPDLQTKASSFPKGRKPERETMGTSVLDKRIKKSNGCQIPNNPNPLTEVQNACDDELMAGSRVTVKVSCIESPQRFWCQKVKSRDLLVNLMQDLQAYYASAQSRPFAESFYVARNAEDNMWHRAQIIVTSQSPLIDVRFIDSGRIQKVPLHDVRPIDPVFLRLGPQAFQCCLSNVLHPSNPTIAYSDSSSKEFEKFTCSVASSENELNCLVKAVGIDEHGQHLHMVDFEKNTACKNLAETCESSEGNVPNPLQVPSDNYIFSSHNIEVGRQEKMWVTFSESINHFYCQLDRTSGLFERVMKDLGLHLSKPQCLDHPLGLNNVCIAKYTDDKWYRGQITELQPKIRVLFVDYGETQVVSEKDIRHFPLQAVVARSTPVLAIPLGLSNVPKKVPEVINQWFAEQAIGQEFTMSVVAVGKKDKFIVELFTATGHVNKIVRQKIEQTKKLTMTSLQHQTEEPCLTVPEPYFVQEKESSPKLPLNVIHKETVAEPSVPRFNNDLQDQQLSDFCVPNSYKWPNISGKCTKESFISAISGPEYFWCQHSNAEELITMLGLTHEEGTMGQHVSFELLKVGCPCLALFSDDNQWYRAQVIKEGIQTVTVLFVDYGNESEVDTKNVRAIPQHLLDITPHAFLCRLNGFDSKGYWEDGVYDAFYNLLIDKTFEVTIISVKEHSENGVPQYRVQIESEGTVVNTVMLKYWKPVSEDVTTESLQKKNLSQCSQKEPSPTLLGFPENQIDPPRFKEPDIWKIKTNTVHASSISEPHFFWCQYADTVELMEVSKLAQEAGELPQVDMNAEALVTGSPCLALFSNDSKWYRAQVMGRSEELFHILFIDYGNESDVNIKNLKLLSQNLMAVAPQAFLCRLNGFDESKGSWDEEVYDAFFNLLVDKSLKVTICSSENHPEAMVPQYAVEIECEGVFVSTLMQKYWKHEELSTVPTEGLKSGEDVGEVRDA